MTWGSVPQERLTISWRSESLPPSAPRCAVITDGFYENTRMPEKAFLERCDSKRRTGIVSGDQGNSSHVANYNTTLSSESLETGTGSWNSLRSASQSSNFGILWKERAKHSRGCSAGGELACTRKVPARTDQSRLQNGWIHVC